MVIDGKAIAEEIFSALEHERAVFVRDLKLGIAAVAGNAVIDSFVRIKERAAKRLHVQLVREDIVEDATTADVEEIVRRLADKTDGIIVQLPLPEHIETDAVLAAIPNEKDIDGINPSIEDHDRLVRAPVARAAQEILQRSNIALEGKEAVVVGAGRLVGKPLAFLLRELGANISVITHEQGSFGMLKAADIIVSGAGEPGIIKPQMIKEGVVLIDAGTSEQGGKVAGDADPACAEKCTVFTPVPGGVGPIAVAMIFKNLFDLAHRAQ